MRQILATPLPVTIVWHTAERSGGNNNCVTVGALPEGVTLKDSDRSNGSGACVCVGLLDGASWRKPTRSGPNDGNCVEAARLDGDRIFVADSKQSGMPGAMALEFRPEPWAAFVTDLRNGRFLLQESDGANPSWTSAPSAAGLGPQIALVIKDGAPWYLMKCDANCETGDHILEYNQGEWDAFVDGVEKREFDVPTLTEDFYRANPLVAAG